MGTGTNEELFKISLAAENEALALYEALAVKFKAMPEAEDFFRSMAMDEREHIGSIETVIASIPPDVLQQKAHKKSLVIAKRFLNYSAAEVLKEVRSLEDAYRATVKLEFSEINKVHELLLELHMPEEDKKRKLYDNLHSHMNKVTRFKQSGIDMSYAPDA